MRRPIAALAALGLLGAAPAPAGPTGFPGPAAQSLGMRGGDRDTSVPLAQTQRLFDRYVREGRVPGIVGAFGRGDAPTVFVSAGKLAYEGDAAPAGPDSLWRIYSMTKPVTAMAAMLLIEEGRLGLDEPIADVLPDFAHMAVLTHPDTSLDSRAAVHPITVRNLLTHTAGLGYDVITRGPLLQEYRRLGLSPEAFNARVELRQRAVRPPSLQEFAHRVAGVPLVAEPGTVWSYSIGLDLLGAVIERASGMPFDRFVQRRLLDPLGMRSTFWQVPAGDAGRLATNYIFVGDTRLPIDPGATSVFLDAPSFPYGGAGLVSSARDYDRFLHMLQDGGTLDGVRVLKPETVALALSNLLPRGVVFGGLQSAAGGVSFDVPMGFGAGGAVTLADSPRGLGKGTYAWGGAAGTVGWVDPAHRARGTLMVNYVPAEHWPLLADVSAALLADLKMGERR